MKIIPVENGYDQFSSFYYKQYQHLDSFDWEEIKKILFSIVDIIFSKESDLVKIGDFGCGDGRILKRLINYINSKGYINFQITAIDISEKMLKIAKKKSRDNVNFIKINLEKEKSKEIFNLIYSFFLLVHIKDLELFFYNIQNNLKNNGIFIFNNIEQKKGFKLPFLKEEVYIEFYNHTDNKVYELVSRYFSHLEIIRTSFSTIFVCEK